MIPNMLIPADEFLQKATLRGLSRSTFKQSMVEMTTDLTPINQLLSEGKNIYFAFDERVSYLKYFSCKESDLPILDTETYTEAFKLLKLIAD